MMFVSVIPKRGHLTSNETKRIKLQGHGKSITLISILIFKINLHIFGCFKKRRWRPGVAQR